MTVFLLTVLIALVFFVWGVLTIRKEVFPYPLMRFLWSRFGKGSSPYHRHRKSLFAVIQRPADVVMIGDSLTDGAEWSELLPDLRVANRGINSDTSALLLQRMEGICKPAAPQAFLMIGINDLASYIPVGTVLQNIENIVNQLEENGTTTHIQSVLHTGPKFARLNPKVTQLNQGLQELAARRNLRYIDLNAALSTNRTLRPELTEDDIHLNGEGYLLWVEAIREIATSRTG